MKNGTDLKTWHIFVILAMIGSFLLLIEAKDIFFPKNYPGESKVLFTEEGDNLFSITESGDSVIILRSDVDRNILCEQTNQVKYFNETLNRRQNDTLKKVLYVLIFISAIAAFFGYKTIKDIKDTAQDETRRVGEMYNKAFELLNKQTEIINQNTSLTMEDVNDRMQKVDDKLKELKTKIQEEMNKLENLTSTADKEFFQKRNELEKEKEETKKDVLKAKDEFKE